MPKAPPLSAPGAGDPLPPAARAAAEAFRVRLPPFREGETPFEGPLDLLLHLVAEHQVDLFDIPIAKITESYLAALEAMRALDLDVAGEFLHMAAQLLLMKSRLLLPRTEVAEDAREAESAGDPRAELVRRLLEYQKYKQAGLDLAGHPLLDREVFTRRGGADRPPPLEGPEGLADVSVWRLIEALDRAVRNARPDAAQELEPDRLSVTDAIGRVAEVLRARRRVSFDELLAGTDPARGRSAVVATFLAILEMARLRLLRVFQGEGGDGPGTELAVEASENLGDEPAPHQEDYR